jgi:hypothetical protein
MADEHPNDVLFWQLAEEHLSRPEVVRSTMMGSPCLRANGNFYGLVHRKTKELIVKLSEDRVQELIELRLGSEFKPAGKVFREWLAVDEPDRKLWGELMDEARAFASA